MGTDAVEEVYRSEWGWIVATLIGLLGDFDQAEEYAQEAFAALYAACADLLRRLGSPAQAATSYRRALDLATNFSERRYLERRLREVQAQRN